MTTRNYHSRNIYIEQLMLLCKQSGDKWSFGVPDKLSNREILLHINSYLKKFNCIPFTMSEIQKISLKMNT